MVFKVNLFLKIKYKNNGVKDMVNPTIRLIAILSYIFPKTIDGKDTNNEYMPIINGLLCLRAAKQPNIK